MLTLLASLLNGKELKEIRETFAAIDADSSGSISLAELCLAFKES
jgi:Ca2+-binding EF-hand superfamily protein